MVYATEASHEHVTLRPRIALEEKAAKQQEAHRAQEKQNRTRHALAELDQMRLAQLHNHQVNLQASMRPEACGRLPALPCRLQLWLHGFRRSAGYELLPAIELHLMQCAGMMQED